VVEDTSTTFVFNVWCTCIQDFGENYFQTGDRQNNWARAPLRCDVACTRAPTDLSIRVAPRPRPPAVPGRAFPTCPRPEAPWGPPEPRAVICPHRTGRARTTDRRSDGGAPLCPLPSPRSRDAPINTLYFPSSAGIASQPRHPRPRHRAAPLPAFHSRATAHVPSLDPIEPSRATCCPGRARVVAGAAPPRPPPSVLAVRPRRCVLHPTPVTLRP
jgi:hypothetical protein